MSASSISQQDRAADGRGSGVGPGSIDLPEVGSQAIPRREVVLVTIVIVLAAVLRLVVAILNDVANDNHLQVVQLMLDGTRSPQMGDCHECFQPKFYYFSFASLARLLDISTPFWQLRVGQVLNAAFGIIVVILGYRFLRRMKLSSGVRIIVVSLAALNPAFLAINGQFTNDSLAILLSVAGIYAIVRYTERPRLRFFWLSAICLSLAFATKGTSWVCGISAVLTLLAGALGFPRAREPHPRRNLILATGLVLMLGTTVAIADYDFKNYQVYANLGKDTKLHMFERTFAARPGVVSIYDSYLTFKFVDLLRYPFTNNGMAINPPHRTSVFSQLYGRLHFLHLDSWPPAWRLTNPAYYIVGRFNLALGLVPTGVFLLGLALGLRAQLVSLARNGFIRWIRQQYGAEFVCLLACMGSLAFIIKFTLDFRDFAGMKPLYLFPGLLGFIKILADGYQFAWDRLQRAKPIRFMLAAASVLLMFGYSADVLVLIGQLVERFRTALVG